MRKLPMRPLLLLLFAAIFVLGPAVSPRAALASGFNAPVHTTASAVSVGPGSGTAGTTLNLTLTLRNASGAQWISRTAFAFSACNGATMEAYNSDFERNLGHYFGAFIYGENSANMYRLNTASGPDCYGGQIGAPAGDHFDGTSAPYWWNADGNLRWNYYTISRSGTDMTVTFNITLASNFPTGTYYFYYMALDAVTGNWQTGTGTAAWTRIGSFTVYGMPTPPTYSCSTTGSSYNGWVNGSWSCTATGSTHATSYIKSTDGSNWTSGGTVSRTTAGSMYLAGMNPAGTAGPASSIYAFIDTTGPSAPTSYSCTPASSSTSYTTSTISCSASGSTDAGAGGVTYQYSRDGGAWTAVDANGKAYISNAADGIRFRAVDGLGNASSAVGPVYGYSDQSAPSAPTSVTGGNSTWANSVLSITPSGGSDNLSGFANYEYSASINGGAYSAWTTLSGASYSVDNKAACVKFRSKDKVGYASGATAPVCGYSDRSGPSTPPVAGENAAWENRDVSITPSGSVDSYSGFDHYEYSESINNDPYSVWKPLSGGSYTVSNRKACVKFRAVDKLDIPSAETAPVCGYSDRSGPSAPTIAGGNASWENKDVSITPSGSSDSMSGFDHYEYSESIRGGSYTPWTTLSEASYILSDIRACVKFRAVDKLGIPSAETTPTCGFSDRSAPSAPSVSSGNSDWEPQVIHLTPSGSEDENSGFARYEYQVSLNDGQFSAWTPLNGTDYPVSDAKACVKFRAVDGVGIASGQTAEVCAYSDLSGPSTPQVDGGNAGWEARLVSLAPSGSTDGYSGFSHYEYSASVNGGAYTPWETFSAAGYEIDNARACVKFRAVDRLGNLSSESNPVCGYSDREAPGAPEVSGGGSGWSGQAVTITPAGTDGQSGVAYYEYSESPDGGTYSGWARLETGEYRVENGAACVKFRAVDRVEQRSPESEAVCGFSDLTPPDAPVAAGGNPAWSREVVTIEASAADDLSGISRYEYSASVNDSEWSDWAPLSEPLYAVDGVKACVKFRAVNGAGLASEASPAVCGHSDRTPPHAGSAARIPTGWTTGVTATVQIGADPNGEFGSGARGVACSSDPDIPEVDTTALSCSIEFDQNSTLYFRTVDGVGNWSETGILKIDNIDSSPPETPPASATQDGWTNAEIVTLSAGAIPDAGGSPVQGYEYRLEGDTNWLPGSSLEVTDPGVTCARFRTVDEAGNRSGASSPVCAHIDRQAPAEVGGASSESELLPGEWSNRPSVSFRWSAPLDTGGAEVARYYYYFGPEEAGTGAQFVEQPALLVEPLGDGRHYLRLQAADAAGNRSEWRTVFAFQHDDQPPSSAGLVEESGGAANGSCQTSISRPAFRWGGSVDAGVGLKGYNYSWVRADRNEGVAAGFVETGELDSLDAVSGGKYILRLQPVDQLGNTASWSTAFTFCYAAGTAAIPSSSAGEVEAFIPQRVHLEFPPGAAGDDFMARVWVSDIDRPAPGANLGTLGGAFVAEADTSGGQPVTQFSEPYRMTIQYTDRDVAGLNEASLRLYYWNTASAAWEAVPASLDTANNLLWADIDHMTEFAVFGENAPMANAFVNLESGPFAVSPVDIVLDAAVLNGKAQNVSGSSAPWQVIDARGLGTGWRVMLSASDFIHTHDQAGNPSPDPPGQEKVIPVLGFSVLVDDADVVMVSGNRKPFSLTINPTTLLPEPLPLSGLAQTILEAAPGDGMGTFEFQPEFSLVIPPSSFGGRFLSVINVLLISGP